MTETTKSIEGYSRFNTENIVTRNAFKSYFDSCDFIPLKVKIHRAETIFEAQFPENNYVSLFLA